VLLLAAVTSAAWPQTESDFSGLWKQDNDRCQPRRSGDVTLRIERHDRELVVETSISNSLPSPRHATQKYTIGGDVSVSTGVDGDEFHTTVVAKDSKLIFTIEEHEAGRILRSQETWSLIENDATLERIRERPNGDKQVLLYRRLRAGYALRIRQLRFFAVGAIETSIPGKAKRVAAREKLITVQI
jgi:hypothetical protein